jgi:hypothetical protein
MQKLLLSLLNGSDEPRVERRRTRLERRHVGERRGNQLVENLRRSATIGESVILSENEVKQVLRLIEAANADPFSSGESVLDDGDLKTLGVEVGEVGNQYGLKDHGDVPRGHQEANDDGELSNRQPLFGPESALVAPDCTPGGRDDIPDSVLRSMKVLSGDEEVAEYEKSTEVHQRREEEPQRHQEPRHQEPRHQEPRLRAPSTTESASPIDILRTTRSLRETSKKQNSRRVIKKVLTEEQKAAIAKLGGPSD